MAKYVNRANNVPLTVVRIFVMSNGYSLAFGLEPLFRHHLADAVVGSLHGMAVGVGHLLEASVAVFICVLNKFFRLAVNADALEIVVCGVRQNILQPVAADDFGHVIKSVVGVGYIGKLGPVSLSVRNLGRLARSVVLVCRLVAEAVGHFLVAGSILVDGIFCLVSARIGLSDKVVAGILRTVAIGREAEGAVDRAELAVCKSGLGQRVAVPVRRLFKRRGGILLFAGGIALKFILSKSLLYISAPSSRIEKLSDCIKHTIAENVVLK